MQLRLAMRSVRFLVGELKKLALALVINYMGRDVRIQYNGISAAWQRAALSHDGAGSASILIQADPTTRPMFPQSHACYELQLRRAVNSRSCGLQLAAVAAGSCWLQLRLAAGRSRGLQLACSCEF